ncbi:patatin-like phospholipase family protein [Rhodomicrobium lacus]|uniref:patatin-like phospholipase family protein n=1 Tax=Rhodomicrobium lacus TaxID=2498452 RepID=UPI0026E1D0D9|nr:patatin-like phospholipase family protein [Rhodomicrobium lacus]WKW51811.1 patatin-like phospholipase family protein [Rhodomicrobium lacus]
MPPFFAIRAGVSARVRVFAAAAACLGAAVALSGCAGLSIRNAPINSALTDSAEAAEAGNYVPTASPTVASGESDTVIGLSFSGGGTRASAFAFGVLQELARTEARGKAGPQPLIDQVSLVSGVSGGSVTAAYFALKGRDTLADFRRRFLVQDVEASLSTSVNLPNLMLLAKGGVNDRSGLPTWLEKNLFRGATFADVLKPGRPQLWINASDIYNRTTFIYNQTNFGALCSDLRRYPLSEAVAASAAVPFVFAPIVIENYADRCRFDMPDWTYSADRVGAPAILRASAGALKRYREKSDVQFVKLLDGGMTDNLGLSGFVLELAAATKPYEPLTPKQVVNLKRFLFVVVDAGRPPGGDLAKSAESPELMDLIQAVSDTAVDANVRAAYDAFVAQMESWRDRMIEYRCGLTPPEVVSYRGTTEGWDCRDLTLTVSKVSFDQMREASVRARLEKIPTRFKLPKDDVDLLISSAGSLLRQNPGYREFMATF